MIDIVSRPRNRSHNGSDFWAPVTDQNSAVKRVEDERIVCSHNSRSTAAQKLACSYKSNANLSSYSKAVDTNMFWRHGITEFVCIYRCHDSCHITRDAFRVVRRPDNIAQRGPSRLRRPPCVQLACVVRYNGFILEFAIRSSDTKNRWKVVTAYLEILAGRWLRYNVFLFTVTTRKLRSPQILLSRIISLISV